MSNDNNNPSLDETNTNLADMAERLTAAGEKAEKQKKQRQARVVKGSHLLDNLKVAFNVEGVTVDETGADYKLRGAAKGRTIYVSKRGGRVDLSGFTVLLDAVRQISEQEAKEKHLGKVRGTLDFNKTDTEILEAFSAALSQLKTSEPAGE